MSISKTEYHDPLFALEFKPEHVREYKIFDNAEAEPVSAASLAKDTVLIVRLSKEGLIHALAQLHKSAIAGRLPEVCISCEEAPDDSYRVTCKCEDDIPDLLSDDPLYCVEEFDDDPGTSDGYADYLRRNNP